MFHTSKLKSILFLKILLIGAMGVQTCAGDVEPIDFNSPEWKQAFGLSSSSAVLSSSSVGLSSSSAEPSSSSSGGGTSGIFEDTRDNKIYNWVKIGDQIWMAENLNFNADGSVCYEYDESNCNVYGRLYNWNVAMSACPAGWYLPTDAEWDALVTAAGGASVAGKRLKAVDTWIFNADHVGIDDFGFSALPGGFGYNGNFGNASNSVGNSGWWWSATTRQDRPGFAWYRNMRYENENVNRNSNSDELQLSVRCVKSGP
ncbi:MAG: hypothetical protein LBC85_06340 [Fibromonadaceae bacterium]|jgi:uncharacterized protein (TIGR02145 family)|nr:hypothetical protein [Fibromonadaceae bacterium]